VKPIVEIDVCGETYSVEANFGFLSEVERTTGISLIRLILNKQDMNLETMRDILRIFVKTNIQDDLLEEFILKNLVTVSNKIFDLLEIAFVNPNPKRKDLQKSGISEKSQKKN